MLFCVGYLSAGEESGISVITDFPFTQLERLLEKKDLTTSLGGR
jgi:hypothetical protein